MKIKRDVFLSILDKVKHGVSKSSYIAAMSYYRFSGNSIISYNDKISIRYPFKTDFKMFVNATGLYNLVSKVPVEYIDLSEKNNKLKVVCKTTNVSLPTIVDDEVSTRISAVTKSIKGAKWKKLPDNFCESLSLCVDTASTNEALGVLTCVKAGGNICISSDNERAAYAKLNGNVDGMFIKATEIKKLVDIQPVAYSITKAWLHFRNADKGIFSIRKVTGKLPDFMQFFDFDGTKVELPKDMADGIDIASIFADELAPNIQIDIENGICMLSVKSDNGDAKHKTKIKYKGKKISFRINPGFLKQMLSHSSSIVIAKQKAKLESDDGNFSMVIAFFTQED